MADQPDKPYDVGYGKPPKNSQFAPGKSGNPKGRPKRDRTAPGAADIEQVFNEICGTAQVQGKQKPIDGREAMYRGLALAGLKGKVSATATLLKEEVALMRELAQGDRKKAGAKQPRGGFLLVPEILTLDEWEAIAIPSQAKLVRDTWGIPERGPI